MSVSTRFSLPPAATPQPESIIGAALDEALRLNKAKAGLILTVAEEAAALKMTAAREVSGDFYDMTDKGMPASLFMAFARTALRASVGRNNTPAEAVAEANRLICQDSFESLYASLFYARLSIASGLCTYVNAGHNPSLLYRAQQDDIVPLTRTGLTVGVDSEAVYEERTVELQPGDFILFYTDGITEAINPAQEEFGMERLRQTLYELKSCPVDEMVSALENALNEYADPAQAFDDVTMMVVRRL